MKIRTVRRTARKYFGAVIVALGAQSFGSRNFKLSGFRFFSGYNKSAENYF